MKRPLLAFAIPLLLAGGAWYTLAPAAAQTGGAGTDGKAAYEANCAACHQPDGRGLTGAFPPLAASDWLHGKTPADVVTTVLEGLEGEIVVNNVTYNSLMPAQSHISDADIAAIATYVMNQWDNPGGSLAGEEVAAQRAALAFLPYCALVPLLGVPAWQLDGFFLGATRGAAMRTAGVISAAGYVALDSLLRPAFANTGVWLAFLCMYALRAAALGYFLPGLLRASDSTAGRSKPV